MKKRPPTYNIESNLMQTFLTVKIPFILTKCKRDSESGCLLWQGSTNGKGYGEIRILNRKFYVHRLILWNKLDKNNTILLDTSFDTIHSCDNPPCCDENHLSLGSKSDNQIDAVIKGRKVMPNNRRLSRETVVEMKLKRNSGRTVYSIAKEYHMNSGSLSRILSGERYSDY